MIPTYDAARVNKAKVAVYCVFFALGFVFANWASRFPAVRDLLDYSPAQMGRLLLIGAVGSMLALPLSGWFIERFGAHKVVRVASFFFAGGYLLVALSIANAPIALVSIGLFVGGFGMGMNDTAINFQGARVERALGRSILPRFHGAFSLGTMAGALIGAAMAALAVSVTVHIAAAVLLAFIPMFVASFKFLNSERPEIDIVEVSLSDDAVDAPTPQAARGSMAREWLSGRTLLIGLIVLAAGLTEGAANDWLALGIVDGFNVSDGLGALGLFIFLSTMTLARFVGTHVLDNYGRVFVLRTSGIFAIGGLVLFALSDQLWLALVGAALWGVGASLGFPIGMSAANDDPARAAARLSVVSTIGYTAFFAGPPLLGELAAHIGYRQAMLVIMIPAAIGVLVASAAREEGSARVALDAKQAARANSTRERD